MCWKRVENDDGWRVVICMGGRSFAGVVVDWEADGPVCEEVVDTGVEVGWD